jgi:hypothetical protein
VERRRKRRRRRRRPGQTLADRNGGNIRPEDGTDQGGDQGEADVDMPETADGDTSAAADDSDGTDR